MYSFRRFHKDHDMEQRNVMGEENIIGLEESKVKYHQERYRSFTTWKARTKSNFNEETGTVNIKKELLGRVLRPNSVAASFSSILRFRLPWTTWTDNYFERRQNAKNGCLTENGQEVNANATNESV